MQRRSLLKLGVGAAVVLGLAGGAASLLVPGLVDARLTPSSREVFHAVGRALLDGSLPAGTDARRAALLSLLDRIDALVASLPPHAQSELSDLLALLATSPGRAWLAHVPVAWGEAGTVQLQQALHEMQVSSLSLARQAYQALHDIVEAAYFSEPATWQLLGYPGPVKV